MKRPGVTLQILWEEYRACHPDGYGYSRFCDLFRSFARKLSPIMRQNHAAGDKVFVDFSGKTVPIIDPGTGEVRQAELFVGVRFAQFYILGRLCNVPFFSLAECNQAVAAAMERMNGSLMRRLGVTRRDLLLSVELPAMQPLPAMPYEYAEWKTVRVNLDYHVEIAGFYYSVPHVLIRQEVEARLAVHVRR